jgi:signal transduction histidine kinase
MKIATRSSTNSPDRRFRLMVVGHFIWLIMACTLGAWWGRLVFVQAARIAELEVMMGLETSVTRTHWHRTQRMLYWESSFFFGLLLACSAFLFWLYWRDVKRARGIQAFFASVTHEMRTPLTSIRLQAESIVDIFGERISESPVRNNVQRLLEDSIRLEAQVERTLELARIEGGGPVYVQSFSIKPWMEIFLNSWKFDHRDQVEFDVQIEDFIIRSDSLAIQVIFKNLIENSMIHSNRSPVAISIEARKNQGGVAIYLRDNGDGFRDVKSLGKIFQKGPSSKGTGIGLYLVKVLMARMGGWVDFKQDPNTSGFQIALWFQECQVHAVGIGNG